MFARDGVQTRDLIVHFLSLFCSAMANPQPNLTILNAHKKTKLTKPNQA
jgi:hypothetical protein